MADEANLVIVARMRDEASPKLKTMTENVQRAQFSSDQLRMTLTATGAAMSAVGALLGRMDSPMAKMASNFLIISGAVLTTASAIMTMLPMIKQLITSLRSLAIMQALLQAISGPGGWISLGIGAAVGAGATAGIMAATSGSRQSSITVNNNVQGSVITERELGEISRRSIVENQQRNTTSGIR